MPKYEFETEQLLAKDNLGASQYVSTRVQTSAVATLPSHVELDGGVELRLGGELKNSAHAIPDSKTYAAVLSVPRQGLARFPARVAVEVEVIPASADSVEVGIRPLEVMRNKHAVAARSMVDELGEIVARENAA